MFPINVLWSAPDINPINKKARSIPLFNPVNIYGRVFTFSWFGFMIAFWSWYAFPPLLTKTIRSDLHLTQNQVSNSNIAALTATLIIRFISGPLCDRFGPRYVFAGCLLAGAIPTACAPAVNSAAGLITLRFFIGVLGASFVPCQVWSTGFFDKNVVGTANALTGGWGNSGGGITYFAMPAIFDSLVHQRGLTPHVAWRVSFVVPFIFITVTASLMLLLCPDTPTGKWSERHLHIHQNIETVRASSISAAPTGGLALDPNAAPSTTTHHAIDRKEKGDHSDSEMEAGHTTEEGKVAVYEHEVVQKPTFKEAMGVIFSLQTLTLAFCYFNSFGAELAVNSILGSYYLKNFPKLGQTGAGRWAAMFGLLNVVTRPLGGIMGDLIYKYTKGNLWAKKMWIHFVGIVTGVFLIAIGLTNPHHLPTMIGLVAGMAIFLEAGNGANFALVPHVHPFANGIVSGVTGASGNLGGIIFAIIFRYHGTHYSKCFWILGIFSIAMNLAVSWIPPVPRKQIGGR